MLRTSLNIFRFSLGNNSHNLDLDCVLHPPVLSEKEQQKKSTVANCVYIVTLEMPFPHPQSA